MAQTLQESITEYENGCEAGRASSPDVQDALLRITRILKAEGLEFCAHNFAFFGSKRYAGCLNPRLKRPIKSTEWAMLTSAQILDFERLTDFPFKI